MGKIYYMMGKSSSGKDTIYKDIRKDLPELKTLTLYTTRPMREGEKDLSLIHISEPTRH